MKVVQINAYYPNGSTGKICAAISDILDQEKIENYVFFTQGTHISNKAVNYNYGKLYTSFQSLKSRIFGNNGFNSNLITKKLIKKIHEIDPDIVHIHNIHAQNLNLELFFEYIKQTRIKIVLTLHDCWLLTGNCMHFDMFNCQKWKTGCFNCCFYKDYSWLCDRGHVNWERKRQLISDVNPIITVPSRWMENIVKNSTLKYKSVNVIYNGINLDVFFPRLKVDIDGIDKGKYIILGVAERWDEKKGLDVFINLSELLDERFQIVLVGTNSRIDKVLPSNIISIHRTSNQVQLAEIYSCADVFVNTTREEVLGLVNLEALACGTPVITFNTGGSPECIDEKTGFVVEKNDVYGLVEAIKYSCEKKCFNPDDCVKRASLFNERELYWKYYELYKAVWR